MAMAGCRRSVLSDAVRPSLAGAAGSTEATRLNFGRRMLDCAAILSHVFEFTVEMATSGRATNLTPAGLARPTAPGRRASFGEE
jgi:hypothetical protein